MLGVKYCRRPAMAEVVSTTKNKITECLMLSGREAGHSTWKLSSTLLIRLEVVCEWVPASVLRVSVCSCSVHSLVFTLLCVHPLAVSTLGVVIWTAVAPAPPS